jgi:prepilin-type N-terminal cleavage/methylation domain-containing protein
MNTSKSDLNGYTLTELLVTIVIMGIAATAVLPQLQKRIEQSAVDSYTDKVEMGLAQLKQNMLSRQVGCTLIFPSGAGGETPINPIDFEVRTLLDKSDPLIDCSSKVGSFSALRIVNLPRHPGSSQQEASLKASEKVELLINQDDLTMTSIGGVAAPLSSGNQKPFVIRLRSKKLYQQGQGFERCVQMEPMTGTLIRGTWIGSSFSNGSCTQNR